MKRSVMVALVISLFSTNLYAQQNNYVLEGKLGNWNKPAVLSVQYVVNNIQGNKNITDTCELVNGHFKISGHLDWPTQAMVVIYHEGTNSKKIQNDVKRLWIEPGKIEINSPDSLKRAVITGSKLNQDQLTWNGEMDNLYQSGKSAQNGSLVPEIPKTTEEIGLERRALELTFMKSHPNSLVSLDLLRTDYGGRTIPDLSLVEPIFNGFTVYVKNSPTGKNYQEQMKKWKSVVPGLLAPDFTQFDPNGNAVKISDYKGKYLLVDFWASWCHPCREENPNLVKQYNLFKDKNFTILSVSIDVSKKNWLDAVSTDKLPWKQVSDLKQRNDAYVKYGVEAIPENFLIGPDGKIIAKSLRGEDLNKKLKEVLDK